MAIYFYKFGNPYGCFSNFSPHPISMGGEYWQTVEHYYQAQKFVGSPDEWLVEKIRHASEPSSAAMLGRDRDRILRADWEIAKIPVMRAAVLTKFLTHSDLQETLLATGEELLVEDSPKDYFWGRGADGSGCNHLGKVLMSIRAQLRRRKSGFGKP